MPTPAKERKPVATAKSERKSAGNGITDGPGKRVTIYLHEGDRRLIRELIAYLAGQGKLAQKAGL